MPVYGSDQVYAAGSTTQVYIPLSSYAHNKLVDGILTEHNQDGTHADVTVDSLTVAGIPLAKASINAPQGFLINGKISRTVASNDITVAIKTLAGSDPSATDPVYCRIGDTVRSITSALSVTKNDGTNWFGSGNTTLATTEMDYFVYLCWNTTDTAVTIAFSRVPNLRVYSDSSVTTTVKNYWAGSGSAPSATDEVENIGRFNATLSATAAFNWSVPGTSIVINRPCFETRVFSYTNPGTAGGTAYWQQKDHVMSVWGVTANNATSTSSSAFTVTFPTSLLLAVNNVVAGVQSVTSTAQQFAVGNGISTTNFSTYIFCQAGTGNATLAFRVTGT